MRRTGVKAIVGQDGVLRLELRLDPAHAGREVCVTIQPLPPMMTQEEWDAVVDRTAGAWKGDFERPPQGEYEKRDWLP